MQKKTEEFLQKIVKKDYNNELEEVLEKKYFEENVKSILLSILYKIEAAYKDYEKVKQNVETKEEFIKNLIKGIQENCDTIKIVKLNTKESEILGNRTFLVDKNRKMIICYPIERKILYCLAKINKNKTIIKDEYFLINQTLSELINVGNNINEVEPMRDFNGYSWTTLPQEIESIAHNLAYQNLRILVGYKFLNNWIENKEFIIDYLESFKNKLEESYLTKNAKNFIINLNELSILLAIKFNPKIKEEMIKLKKETEEKLSRITDNKKFVQEITNEKRNVTYEIKIIDETLNNKEMLQQEYIKRNENLPLQEKIFSIRILSQIMIKERDEKIKKIEKLNELLKPKKFIKYKKELEKKQEYLKLVETKNIEDAIDKSLINLQKSFLACFLIKVQKAKTNKEVLSLIYEFRYYLLLPFTNKQNIEEIPELKNKIEKVLQELLKKSHELKVIDLISKDENIDYEVLKNIFHLRIINLEDLYIKIIKEKEKFFIQLFDENVYEEKIELNINNFNKKDLEIKFNKKVKIFNK